MTVFLKRYLSCLTLLFPLFHCLMPTIFMQCLPARSPVFSYLNATLQGLHTIRAFGNQRRLIKQFDSFQDVHTSAHFLFICARRWLSVRLDWLCALFVTTTSFASVLAAGSKYRYPVWYPFLYYVDFLYLALKLVSS